MSEKEILSTKGEDVCMKMENVTPPVAPMEKHSKVIHGVEMEDQYYYMREKTDERVKKYISSENKFFEKKMEHTKELQGKMFEEMKALVIEDDKGLPFRFHNHYYFYKTEKGKEYYSYFRKKLDDKEGETEEMWIDVNKMAEGKKYCRMGTYAIDVNERFVAFSMDFTGDSLYTIYVLDFQTKKIIETIEGERLGGSLCLGNDGKYLFYLVKDSAKRRHRIMRHLLGSNSTKDDVIVYEDKDRKFSVGVRKSISEKYIFFRSRSDTTVEEWVIEASGCENAVPKLIRKREHDVEYVTRHRGDDFIVLENSGECENFRVVSTPVETPFAEGKKVVELIGHSDDVYIFDLRVFRDFMFVNLREKGFVQLCCYYFSTGKMESIDFAEENYDAYMSTNLVFDAQVFRMKYSSMVTPTVTYDYSPISRKLVVRKKSIPEDSPYRPENYATIHFHVASRDKTAQIPVSMVYNKEKYARGANCPVLLYGYGAYGISTYAYFRKTVVPLLDRGFAYAIAHVRGGAECGRRWYKTGKMDSKKNSFNDFIDVAKYLVSEKYTSTKKLACYGASAGGLLIGAVITDPDAQGLFRCACMDVPFVDIIWTMLDDSIPLTIGEYEEWGNPVESKSSFEYMLSYSPYDSLFKMKYLPITLVCGSMNDSAVQYWEPTKFVARARRLIKEGKIGCDKMLLKIDVDVGHGGKSGRYESLKEMSEVYSFFVDNILEE